MFRKALAIAIGMVCGLVVPGTATTILGWWVRSRTWESQPGQVLTIAEVAPGQYQLWQSPDDQELATVECIPAGASSVVRAGQPSKQVIDGKVWSGVLEVSVRTATAIRITPKSAGGRVMLQPPVLGPIILIGFGGVFVGLFVWWLSATWIYGLLTRRSARAKNSGPRR